MTFYLASARGAGPPLPLSSRPLPSAMIRSTLRERGRRRLVTCRGAQLMEATLSSLATGSITQLPKDGSVVTARKSDDERKVHTGDSTMERHRDLVDGVLLPGTPEHEDYLVMLRERQARAVAGGEPTRPSEQEWLQALLAAYDDWYRGRDWQGRFAPLIDRERAAERKRVADVLQGFATKHFLAHGPDNLRGAALWDAAVHINEKMGS